MLTEAFQADSLKGLSDAISAFLTTSGGTGVSIAMDNYNAGYRAILLYTPS